MRLICASLACFLTAFLSGPAVLADVLTLEGALQEAFANNVELQAERLRIQTAVGDRKQAGLFFPSNPEFEFERGSDSRLDGTGERSMSFAISQEIEIWGQRGKRKRIADLEIRRSAADVDRFSRLLARDVTVAYYAHVLTEQKMLVSQEVVRLVERVSDAAKRRHAVGDISALELTLLSSELAEVAAEGYRLKGDSQATGAELNFLIGRPPNVPAKLASDVRSRIFLLTPHDLVRVRSWNTTGSPSFAS